MATSVATFINHPSAQRQLQALVRKYNQATVATLGYKLEITFDTQDSSRHITYTLIMKNSETNHWQLKRVSSTLLGDFEKDFNSMVLLMETNLTTHE